MSFKKGDRISRQDNGVQGVVLVTPTSLDNGVFVRWDNGRGSSWSRLDVVEHVNAINQLADLVDPA